MNAKQISMKLFFVIYLHTLTVTWGENLSPPQFDSDWQLMQAQMPTLSTLELPHGLGEVPRLVEVLVKSMEDPNKDFIFKAIGSCEKDDDNADPYGGVCYMYNSGYVRIMVPNSFNQRSHGSSIYTGEAPYWKGPNVHSSKEVYVRARCWKEDALPTPCFTQDNLYMAAGSSVLAEVFHEVPHYLSMYPSMMKVRARLTDGPDPGWYIDAQGSSLVNFNSMHNKSKSGGLKFGYSNASIRIWTSSYPYPVGVLFTREDGWGDNTVMFNFARQGLIDIYALCGLTSQPEMKDQIPFGPAVSGEVMEIQLPHGPKEICKIMINTMVEVTDGPNQSYLFETVGSAMTNTFKLGSPCAYGGLITAYSTTTLRMWRPKHINGAAVCISESMGLGQYSQAAHGGNLHVQILQLGDKVETPAIRYSQFTMIANGSAFNSEPIASKTHVTSSVSCGLKCLQHYTSCVLFTFDANNVCNMYNTTNISLLYLESGSQVWESHSKNSHCDIV